VFFFFTHQSYKKSLVRDYLCNNAQTFYQTQSLSAKNSATPHIFKTPTFSQQNQRGNESPKSEATEATKPNQNEPLMNEQEAAKFLGISRMTLLRKRNAGEIGFYRVGFRVLYSKEKHLIPFLETCEK
jgi:excisionase family DNA binding protein